MVAGEIKAVGTVREVLTSELISQAYCLPVQVVKHPFMDVPLVLPESGKIKGLFVAPILRMQFYSLRANLLIELYLSSKSFCIMTI